MKRCFIILMSFLYVATAFSKNNRFDYPFSDVYFFINDYIYHIYTPWINNSNYDWSCPESIPYFTTNFMGNHSNEDCWKLYVDTQDNVEYYLSEYITPNDYVDIEGVKCSVVGIENNMFHNNKSLKNVVITSNIKCIEDSAFADCTNLKTVEFRTDSITIMDKAFANTAIEEVTLPKYLNLDAADRKYYYGYRTGVYANCFDNSQVRIMRLPNISRAYIDNMPELEVLFVYGFTLVDYIHDDFRYHKLSVSNSPKLRVVYIHDSSFLDSRYNSSFNVDSSVDLNKLVVYVPKGTVEKFKKKWPNIPNIVEGTYKDNPYVY